jgi:hypothetical protein
MKGIEDMNIRETIIRPNNKYDFFRVIIGSERATFDTFEKCKSFCERYWSKQKEQNRFFVKFDKATIEGEYDFCEYELYATYEVEPLLFSENEYLDGLDTI